MRINNNVAIIIVDRVTELLSNGGIGGKLKVYTEPYPVSSSEPSTGTLLVEITGITWAAATVPIATSAAIADITIAKTGTAVATGDAYWARLSDPSGEYVIDGMIGVSGGDFIIDTISIITGAVITLTGLRIMQYLD